MQLEVRIERYADQGRCIAHADGRVIFVRFALPGELVRIELDEPHRRADRFWTGEVVQVLEPAAERVQPIWPLAGPLAEGGGLGGADLIHVSLAGQLAWKQAVVTDQMKRLGHLDIERTVGSIPITHSLCFDEHGCIDTTRSDEAMQGLGWRTRIDLVAADDGRPAMRRRATHIRVPVDGMPLATQYVQQAGALAGVWDGSIPDISGGDRIRITAAEPRTIAARDAAAHGAIPSHNADATAHIVSATAHTASAHMSVMVADRVVFGEPVIHEEAIIPDPRAALAGIDVMHTPHAQYAPLTWQYTVDVDGFWQVHRNAPSQLVYTVLKAVLRELDGHTDATVWDLYSGAGLFTMPLATTAVPDGRVLSIEGAPRAVHHARNTISSYGLQHVQALEGDVYRTLAHLNKPEYAHPEVVVLDPPRAGAKRKVVEQIAQSGARSVIYVACDPASLARDIATFSELGYTAQSIAALDIYPHTHHVETMAVLSRKG